MRTEASARPRRSPCDRILGTATRLVHAEGVHAGRVGRLVAERSRQRREQQGQLTPATPRDVLPAAFARMCGVGAGHRDCPFVDTSAAYPGPARTAVREAVNRILDRPVHRARGSLRP